MITSTDPTSLIVQNKEVNPLDFLPIPYTTSDKPAFVVKIKRGDPLDIDNLPPVYVSNPEDYKNLQERKATFSRYSRVAFEQARDLANPYEGIGRSIFMNRAGLKIANIDIIYKLTRHIGAFMHLSTPGPFKFCDLAGAPGAFTQYIQWRRPDAVGYGISLRSTKPDVPAWNLNLIDQTRFFPYYGDDDTGDLFREWKSFVNRVKRDQVLGVDLVTADGGFDVETEKAFSRQEFLSFRLILVEVLTALKVLAIGGDLMVKMFDTVTQPTAELLYICSLCFDRITLFKPITSRPANAEKYLICQGRKKGTEVYELILEQVSSAFLTDENVISFLPQELPADFVNWLKTANDNFIANQQEAVDWIIDFLQKRQPIIPPVDNHKALIVFDVPGEPITKKSRIQIPGSGRATRK